MVLLHTHPEQRQYPRRRVLLLLFLNPTPFPLTHPTFPPAP